MPLPSDSSTVVSTKPLQQPSFFRRGLSYTGSWLKWGASLAVNGSYSAYQYTRSFLRYEQTQIQQENAQATRVLSTTERAIADGVSGAVKGAAAAVVIYSGASWPVIGLVSLGLLPKNTMVKAGKSIMGNSFQNLLDVQQLAGHTLALMHWALPSSWIQISAKKGTDALVRFTGSEHMVQLYQDHHIGERIWLWTGAASSVRNDLKMLPAEFKQTRVMEYQQGDIKGTVTDTQHCKASWLFRNECKVERHLTERDLRSNTTQQATFSSENDGQSWIQVSYENVSDAKSYRAEYEGGVLVRESRISHLPAPTLPRVVVSDATQQLLEIPQLLMQSTTKTLFPFCLAITALQSTRAAQLMAAPLNILLTIPIAGASWLADRVKKNQPEIIEEDVVELNTDDVSLMRRRLITPPTAGEFRALPSHNLLSSSLDQGLTAYFPFNGNALDQSGNGNHGTLYGPVLTEDRMGKNNAAYYFNGNNDYIDGDASNFPTAERTTAIWFKFAGGMSLFGYGGINCGTSWLLFINNPDGASNTYEMQSHCRVNRILYQYTQSPSGSWHHMAVTTDVTGSKIYIDGVRVATSNIFVTNTYVAGKNFGIGTTSSPSGTTPSDATTIYFRGSLDEVRVYSRSLSACEISDLYQQSIIANNELWIGQGQTITLSPNNLNVTTDNPSLVSFTVSNIQHGLFFINGIQVTSFTQWDINNNRVRFQHSGNALPPSYQVTVNYQTSHYGPFTSQIIFNRRPQLLANALSITEGEAVTLTSNNLWASDDFTPPGALTFIVSNVQYGQFELLANAGMPITSFTQQQITDGMVRFVHNGNPTAPTFSVTVTDGEIVGPSTASVNFTNVNDAPVLSSGGGSFAFTENDAATVIEASLTVSDADSVNLNSATVLLSSGFVSGEDVLSCTTPLPSGISSCLYTGNTLMLSGSASVANYQSALRSVRYQDISDNPSAANRTAVFQVNDGSSSNNLSNNISRTIMVRAVNDAPVLSNGGGSFVFTENDAVTVIDTSITVSDADSVNLSGATVLLSSGFVSGEDVLSCTTPLPSGISSCLYTGNTLTLSGSASVASYQSALRGVSYQDVSDNPYTTSRTVVFRVSDGSVLSNAVTRTIDISSSNDTPTLVSNQFAINQGQPLALTLSNLRASDADNVANTLQFTVSNVQNGQFEFSNNPGVPITNFSQQNILDGLVKFIPDSNINAPNFMIAVSDGQATTTPIAASINFIPALVSSSTGVAAAPSSSTASAAPTVSSSSSSSTAGVAPSPTGGTTAAAPAASSSSTSLSNPGAASSSTAENAAGGGNGGSSSSDATTQTAIIAGTIGGVVVLSLFGIFAYKRKESDIKLEQIKRDQIELGIRYKETGAARPPSAKQEPTSTHPSQQHRESLDALVRIDGTSSSAARPTPGSALVSIKDEDRAVVELQVQPSFKHG